MLALFISIQGGLVKNEKDINTKVYEILGNIIKEKEKNIDKIEEFTKFYC